MPVAGDDCSSGLGESPVASQVHGDAGHFRLAFPGHRSDESSCANQAQKGFTTMTNAEATTTETAATVAEQGAHRCAGEGLLEEGCQPEEGRAQGPENRQGRQSQGRAEEGSQGRQEGRQARPAKEASTPRAESKGAKILELIGRPKGASLAEIMKATDWQAHSVRGFLSTAAKKHGLKIESTKTEAGDRVYQVKK